jgi:membrane protein DedA with SNARE-associated domain
MEWVAHLVQYFLAKWGYLALAAALFGESAGLPLPGETVLLFSSFVAHKTGELHIGLIILIGTTAAICGDNLGYLAGRHFGPRLLKWLKRTFNMEEDLAAAGALIRRHGGATVFWARYVIGLRAIAGPVAGALNMEWKRFLLYNALGGFCWVSSISLTGYFFASRMQSLTGFIEKASWGIAGTVFAVGYLLWRRMKKQQKLRTRQRQAA